MSDSLATSASPSPAESGKGRGSGRKSGSSTHKPGTLVKHGAWWWAIPGVAAVASIHYVATFIGAAYAFTDFTGLGDANFVGLDNFGRIGGDFAVTQ